MDGPEDVVRARILSECADVLPFLRIAGPIESYLEHHKRLAALAMYEDWQEKLQGPKWRKKLPKVKAQYDRVMKPR